MASVLDQSVSTRYVDVEHVAVAERHESVERIDALRAADGLCRKLSLDVGEHVDVLGVEHVRFERDVLILVCHVVAAERCVERNAVGERLLEREQEIVVDFDFAYRLFAVHSLGVCHRVERLLLGAEIVVEVDSRTQRERQYLRYDVSRNADVSVDSVAALRVQMFVGDCIRVVERRVDEVYRGVLLEMPVHTSADVLVVHVVHRNRRRLPISDLSGVALL